MKAWFVGWMIIGIAACRGRSGESSAEQNTQARLEADAGRATPRSAPSTSADGLARVRAEASARSGPEPVGGSWTTCYAHYRPTSTPERDVTRLGLMCGPANGMRLVGTMAQGEVGEGAVDHPLDVRPGDCFRIFAVADSQVSDLALEVRDPKGVPVASDHNNDRWPILNPDGPFCLLEGGKFTVRLHARQGMGRYAFQIWQLP
ncbi:MAG TPA: hypothetical protein VF881_19470 [Polyangiaceae bacterium]